MHAPPPQIVVDNKYACPSYLLKKVLKSSSQCKVLFPFMIEVYDFIYAINTILFYL